VGATLATRLLQRGLQRAIAGRVLRPSALPRNFAAAGSAATSTSRMPGRSQAAARRASDGMTLLRVTEDEYGGDRDET
jgi:hypothetical protein